MNAFSILFFFCIEISFCFVCQFFVEDGEDIEPRSKLRLIVPNSSCGGIIGKGGSTIKYGCCSLYLLKNYLVYFFLKKHLAPVLLSSHGNAYMMAMFVLFCVLVKYCYLYKTLTKQSRSQTI